MEHRCPVCDKTVGMPVKDTSGRPGFFPFCSQRCKLLDLGAWLDAEYKIVSGSSLQDPEELPGEHTPPRDTQ